MRRVQIIGALCLAVVACLLGAVSASAAPGDPFLYKRSFAISPDENLARMVVNHQTGNILTFSNSGQVSQFDPEGNPVNFPALGSPTFFGPSGSLVVAIDNTGGPMQGNFYVMNVNEGFGSQNLWSFSADGNPIGVNPHPLPSAADSMYGNALNVMADGTLRVVGFDNSGSSTLPAYTQILDPMGGALSPPESIALYGQDFGGFPAPSGFDELGNFYVYSEHSHRKYKFTGGFADLGKTGLPFGQPVSDPSTNDMYVRSRTKIYGIHYSDPVVESAPFVALDGLAEGNGINDGGPIAFDATGQTLFVVEGGKRVSVFRREPASAPFGLQIGVSGIRSSRAVVDMRLNQGGAPTSYHFEYGTSAAYGFSTPEANLPPSLFPASGSQAIEGLQPDTTYHLRLVATNAKGTTYGPDRTFKTYPTPGGAADSCPNALARKQTTAQRLPDCRAYELASAPDTGGYDVESYLAPGQTPFPGFPLAKDKLLYATHSGAVPGPWSATNNGPDPYLASRTANGWVTDYKGLPSDLNPQAGSFSSVLGEADSSLGALAFAGPGLCDPCFSDGGLETGIPVRLPSGQLVQGMAGSLSASVPASAKPEGKVAKYFSGDGRQLLFASKYAFEPGANDDNGSLTVYERDLGAETTEIVSTDPAGNALTGSVSELDVSADGSRVLIGKGIATDPQGNEYVHPYLHIAGRPGSVDLAPGATTGVLYAGMTEDGSKVFFTTPDQLLGSDTDTGADLYEAVVDGSGSVSLRQLTGANSDACSPVANESGAHWNTTGANVDCGAVAIAGGGGVASSTGAVYFLSPEELGGQGTPNQPNLYLAEPGGSISLVATLEPDNPVVIDSVKAAMTRRTGDFQTTPSGNYAVFASALPLTGVDYFGFRNVFRYAAAAGQLACPSCDTSGSTDATLADDVELAPNGLSLLEDGRAFFTTRFPLLLNDANGKKDVYEWSEGAPRLISSGTGPFDSALLSASADGTDVFFFTHEDLAPEEDRNGALTRIYDAREGGGFFKLPAFVPCKASDECHGPGSPAPAPPNIRSSGKTTQGNVIVCAKKRVKKRGQCVKKKAHKKKHHKAKKRKGGAKKRTAQTNGKRGGRHA